MFYTFSNTLFVKHVPQDLQDAVEAIQPGYYSCDNAAAWIQPNVFLPWLSNTMMGRVALQRDNQTAMIPELPPTRPTAVSRSRTLSALSWTSSAYFLASLAPSWSTPTPNASQKGKSQEIDPVMPLVFNMPQKSKKRAVLVDSDDDLVEISSDDDVAVPRYVLTPFKKRKIVQPEIKQEPGEIKIRQEVIEIYDSDTNDTQISVTRCSNVNVPIVRTYVRPRGLQFLISKERIVQSVVG